MSSNLQNSKDVILVTGFGPFHDHTVNASWEAVKLLNDYKNDKYTIVTKQISVEYDEIDKKLPQLWNELKPKLVVHVGVSHLAEKLTIERRANRTGYMASDVSGKLCKEGECCTPNETPQVLDTGLNIDNICKQFNTDSEHVQACISTNAGRYLCEYIYYKSLSFNHKSTIFIHVPMLDSPYSAEELASGLIKIINMAFEQLYKKDDFNGLNLLQNIL